MTVSVQRALIAAVAQQLRAASVAGRFALTLAEVIEKPLPRGDENDLKTLRVNVFGGRRSSRPMNRGNLFDRSIQLGVGITIEIAERDARGEIPPEVYEPLELLQQQIEDLLLSEPSAQYPKAVDSDVPNGMDNDLALKGIWQSVVVLDYRVHSGSVLP